MRQKYLILNNDDQNELIIREFSELDDKAVLLLGEQKYDIHLIKSTLKKGKKALTSALRTEKLYPPHLYADKIAESVILMFEEKKQSIELLFDDVDLFTKKKSKLETFRDIKKESNEFDELLEEDFEEDFEEDLLKNDSLMIEDDRSFDIDG